MDAHIYPSWREVIRSLFTMGLSDYRIAEILNDDDEIYDHLGRLRPRSRQHRNRVRAPKEAHEEPAHGWMTPGRVRAYRRVVGLRRVQRVKPTRSAPEIRREAHRAWIARVGWGSLLTRPDTQWVTVQDVRILVVLESAERALTRDELIECIRTRFGTAALDPLRTGRRRCRLKRLELAGLIRAAGYRERRGVRGVSPAVLWEFIPPTFRRAKVDLRTAINDIVNQTG